MRLPVCPHCKAVYRYGDVRRLIKKRETTCYHCKKNFKICRSKIWLLALIFVVICIAVDIIFLNVFINMTVIAVYVINVILFIIALTLKPFYIKFKR